MAWTSGFADGTCRAPVCRTRVLEAGAGRELELFSQWSALFLALRNGLADSPVRASSLEPGRSPRAPT
jgi:hypothetical protein